MTATEYISDYEVYDVTGIWLLDVAVMSKGVGPAFLIVLAGLLPVICFGMTRPRTVYLDEDHEVWGPPPRKK